MNPFDSKTLADEFIDHQEVVISFQFKQMRKQSCCFLTAMIFFSMSPFGFGVLLGCLTNWFTDENPTKEQIILAQHLSGIFFGVSLFILVMVIIGFTYYVYSHHYSKMKIDEKIMKSLRVRANLSLESSIPVIIGGDSSSSTINPLGSLGISGVSGDEKQGYMPPTPSPIPLTHRTQPIYSVR